MKNFNTGSKDLDKWLNFYHHSPKSTTKFIYLLTTIDKSYLTFSPTIDIEDELNDYLPALGVIDLDFNKIAFNEDQNFEEIYNRIVCALFYHVNFDNIKEKYEEKFNEVVEKSLVNGNYEQYNIDFEKVIAIAYRKNYIVQSDIMGLSLLRGLKIGQRYDNKDKIRTLKLDILKNKVKKFFHI